MIAKKMQRWIVLLMCVCLVSCTSMTNKMEKSPCACDFTLIDTRAA